MRMTCGHLGCCDSSPRRHASAHAGASVHPIVRPCEPGKDWYQCCADDVVLELKGAPPEPSHP
jgi:hypothetical protein